MEWYFIIFNFIMVVKHYYKMVWGILSHSSHEPILFEFHIVGLISPFKVVRLKKNLSFWLHVLRVSDSIWGQIGVLIWIVRVVDSDKDPITEYSLSKFGTPLGASIADPNKLTTEVYPLSYFGSDFGLNLNSTVNSRIILIEFNLKRISFFGSI